MSLPLAPPFAPMEAQVAERLPEEAGWQFEPKWDGFRCLAFRDGERLELQSKAGRPLARYFPDVAEALRRVRAPRFVLDGEIIVPAPGGGVSFEALQLRLHPAASRVRRLAAERPAAFAVFDLLVDAGGRLCAVQPLAERRPRLERLAARAFDEGGGVFLSPASQDPAVARGWLARPRAGLDGVMAKRLDEPYRSGERRAMRKIKPQRSADCVVGGFRRAGRSRAGGLVLLLGLHDARGLLHYVGHTATLPRRWQERLEPQLLALRPRQGHRREEAGFRGRSPDAPSRWSRGRRSAFEPLAPELVVEVGYRQWSDGRFRHGTRLLRPRPDKRPDQCTFAQIPEAREEGGGE